MVNRLRVLHLEDNRQDAELVQAILADYNLPTFDGLSAQRLTAQLRPDLPFIFVSGSIGEDCAIDRLKDGATDYVLKDRIGRLPSAVRRALVEGRERTERQHADAEVRRLNAELEQRVIDRTRDLEAANAALAAREDEERRTKAFLSSIVEDIPDMIFVKDARDLRFVQINRAAEELVDDLLGKSSVGSLSGLL